MTLVLIGLGSTLLAEEATQEQLQIRAMIQEIKEAPEGERYMKMNAFKKQLRQMNAQNRQEALQELQTQLATKEQTQTQTQQRTQLRVNEDEGEGEMIRTRTQTRTQQQLQEAQQQLQMQNQIQNQNRIQKMDPGALGTTVGPKGGR